MCMYCKGIIGRISPTPFSMQVCIIFQVNYENCLYKKHFLSLTYLQFWSVNWIMRQMLLQTKQKKKQPQNQQIMKKKMSGDQIIQKLMAVRVLYLTPKNSLTPNKKDHLWIRLDNPLENVTRKFNISQFVFGVKVLRFEFRHVKVCYLWNNSI